MGEYGTLALAKRVHGVCLMNNKLYYPTEDDRCRWNSPRTGERYDKKRLGATAYCEAHRGHTPHVAAGNAIDTSLSTLASGGKRVVRLF